MIDISPLRPEDRAGWQPLGLQRLLRAGAARRRLRSHFWPPAEGRWAAWSRRVARRSRGRHRYKFQASIRSGDVCYLADLFVDEPVRGQGLHASW